MGYYDDVSMRSCMQLCRQHTQLLTIVFSDLCSFARTYLGGVRLKYILPKIC